MKYYIDKETARLYPQVVLVEAAEWPLLKALNRGCARLVTHFFDQATTTSQVC